MKKMIVVKDHEILQNINQATDIPGIRKNKRLSKSIGYKIDIQMSVRSLYTSNEHLEFEIKINK